MDSVAVALFLIWFLAWLTSHIIFVMITTLGRECTVGRGGGPDS